MEQFKLVHLFKNMRFNRNSKILSMLKSFKCIVGDDYINSEEVIYIKNLYNYFNNICTIDDVFIYAVKNNKFYCVSYSNEFNGYCLNSYPLSEIKFTQLKEGKKHYEYQVDLTIYFKNDDILNLNSVNDTFGDLASIELSEVILNIYSKLN